jgi:Flp pilus assembly protein CpaB
MIALVLACLAFADPVVVADKDVALGEVLIDVSLAELSAPPPDHYTTVAEVKGRVASEPIFAGEVVRSGRVADAMAGRSLQVLIPRGMRSIEVDAAGPALGARPSDYVDVWMSGVGSPSCMIMQAVYVLAIITDDRMVVGPDATTGGATRIVLAVTQEQAEMLTHAEAVGKVVLTLRTPLDFALASEGACGQ